MAYRMVYLRIRSNGYNPGWASDADQAVFKEESRRLFQELGWTLRAGRSGVCDTVTKGDQDLYLHPTSFSGVLDEANILPLRERLSKAQSFQCYHCDCYEEYLDMSDEEYRAALEAKRGEITDRNGQKPQVNMFRRKRRQAPFPMKRGVFMPSRREFRHKTQITR